MSTPSDEDDIKLAFEIALSARQPTFLALYPRSLKLAVTALLLAGLVTPVILNPPHWESLKEEVVEVPKEEAPVVEEQPTITLKPAAALPEDKEKVERYLPKTEAEKAAAAFNDSDEPTRRMAVAPDPSLVEEINGKRLPKVGTDGRKPWQVYARPFDQGDPRPRIALVIGDMGLSRVATDAVIRRLPGSVTLAFDVQGDSLEAWLDRARQDGHETLLSVAMEPLDYPRSDPGPQALLTTLPNADNIDRLQHFLSVGAGYVGVTSLTGSRFIGDTVKLTPVLEALRHRGLLALDVPLSPHSVVASIGRQVGVPVGVVTRQIDENPTPEAIDAALMGLEHAARVEGGVIALASPLPLTLDRLELWAAQLASRGVVLAPLSAVVR